VSLEPILKELADVLIRKFRQRDVDARAARKLFASAFVLVTPQPLVEPASRDLDDDLVLAAVIAAECAAVVAGDQDLLTLDPFRGIRILVPLNILEMGGRNSIGQ
jgi:predicted nucleic acid-binding protein